MVEQDPLVGQCPITVSFNLKSPLTIVEQCPTTGPFSLKCPQPIVGQSPLGHQSRKSSSGTGKYPNDPNIARPRIISRTPKFRIIRAPPREI